MGKKNPRKKSQQVVVNYDSDDERAYSKEKVPDRQAKDFIHDEVDEFHTNKEKILLGEGASLEPAGFSSDEQDEVLGFDDSDSDLDEYDNKLKRYETDQVRDEMASDLDDDDDGLPDDKAWGKKKSKFYGGDVEDERDLEFSGSDTGGAAELEEQEVIAMQKKMAEQLDEDDFGMEIFQTAKKQAEEDTVVSKEVVTKDLSKLSKKEKLILLKKESPELLDLIEDYKTKLTDVKTKYGPILNVIQSGVMPASRGTEFIKTQIKLYLNYCVNISFYLMLKAKRIPVHNHPVVSRLVQYRNLMKQLEPVKGEMEPYVQELLQKIENGEEIKMVTKQKPEKKKILKRHRAASSTVAKKKKLSELVSESSESSSEDEAPAPSGGRSRKRANRASEQYETVDEKEALAYYDMMKAGRSQAGEQDERLDSGDESVNVEEGKDDLEDEGDGDGDGKRGITYQIEKNKGLTPHRKKEYRNPRVKHRMKFRKAKIRRKGQVREARTEMNRYDGEFSGIRAGIKRGVRIKS